MDRSNIIPTIKYLGLTLKHKWYVFLAGLKLRKKGFYVSLWRLIKHDWSKFLPSELPHYGRHFFGSAENPYGFVVAWVKHQNRHDHHWEYWIPRTGHNRGNPPHPDYKPVEMPLEAVHEMIADWMGASRAYEEEWPEPGKWSWLSGNFKRIILDGKTQEYLISVLRTLGFSEDLDKAMHSAVEVNVDKMMNFPKNTRVKICPVCGSRSIGLVVFVDQDMRCSSIIECLDCGLRYFVPEESDISSGSLLNVNKWNSLPRHHPDSGVIEINPTYVDSDEAAYVSELKSTVALQLLDLYNIGDLIVDSDGLKITRGSEEEDGDFEEISGNLCKSLFDLNLFMYK